jgi:signal transduction histidine kinase
MPDAFLRAVFPRQVRWQLALLLMLVVTLLTSVIGAMSYYQALRDFQQDRQAFKDALSHQMGPPLAAAMWNFDVNGASVLLDTKLSPMVQALTAYDAKGNVWLRREMTPALAADERDDSGEVFRMDLPRVDDTPVGALEVLWSDAPFRQSMQQTLLILVMQLVLFNSALLATFWFGVDRLVFRRLNVLQQALDRAAQQKDLVEVEAPQVVATDEFSALTDSINAIIARLRRELEAGQQSEESARNALVELQNAQEGLVRSEKMAALGSLVAGVAHELNTPIGNIVTVASTQQERTGEFSQAAAKGLLTRRALDEFLVQAREGADLVFNNATRAAELIQSFKQVAVDQTSERLRSFDLASHISDVLSVTSPLLNKRSVVIHRHLATGIAMTTYPGPLGQVLTNLLTNAVLHGFENQPAGIIRVTCSSTGGSALIEVADNGCGMEPDILGKIFDPFFTTKLGRGGTGLGLHICHNIVYGPLQGSMQVTSVPGQGTTFTIELPCQI